MFFVLLLKFMLDNPNTLATRVRSLRISRGWTQEELAEYARIDYKYYQRFEAGLIEEPSLKWLKSIADGFKLPPWVLMCDDIEIFKQQTGIDLAEISSQRPPGRPRKTTKKRAL